MPADIDSAAAAFKAKIEEKSQAARAASTIDEALEIQAQGMADALREALLIFKATATVNGGICTNGGPVNNALIT